MPWQAPTLVAAHSCVLSWWRAVKGADAPPEWAAYRRWTLAGLRAAGLVVAPTRAFLGQVQALYGPLERARWIWNGRDAAVMSGADKEPLIFAAGRVWDEAKNLGALAAVADRLPWPLAIAGPGAPGRANLCDCSCRTSAVVQTVAGLSEAGMLCDCSCRTTAVAQAVPGLSEAGPSVPGLIEAGIPPANHRRTPFPQPGTGTSIATLHGSWGRMGVRSLRDRDPFPPTGRTRR